MPIEVHGLPITKEFDYNLTAVLIGPKDVGKTTLVESSYQCLKLTLIDTPSIRPQRDSLSYSIEQRNALTQGAFNAIFIVLKFEKNFDQMLKLYQAENLKIQIFKDRVVLIITHWDHSTDKVADKEEIIKMLDQDCQKIIFVSESDFSNELFDIMIAFMSQIEPKKLDISDKEFIENFKVLDRLYEQLRGHNGDSFERIKKFKIVLKQLTSGFTVIGEKIDDKLIGMLDDEFKKILDEQVANMKEHFDYITSQVTTSVSQETLFKLLWKCVQDKISQEIEHIKIDDEATYKSLLLSRNYEKLEWAIDMLKKLSHDDSNCSYILDDLSK